MDDLRCATCRFWDRDDGADLTSDDGFACCCRYAPRALTFVGERDGAQECTATAWPTTYFADWCGEHAPRPSDNSQG